MVVQAPCRITEYTFEKFSQCLMVLKVWMKPGKEGASPSSPVHLVGSYESTQRQGQSTSLNGGWRKRVLGTSHRRPAVLQPWHYGRNAGLQQDPVQVPWEPTPWGRR